MSKNAILIYSSIDGQTFKISEYLREKCKTTISFELKPIHDVKNMELNEYEIIIIEPGFNQWLATQPPRGYYEQFWLENRNIFYVTEYNNRVINTIQYDPNLYLQQIDYQRGVDYGYEVNYLLYNWFEYFQQRNNQKLR